MLKLTEATVAQQNAAFDKIYPELQQLVQQYIPYIFQGQVTQQLQSPAGRALVVKLIDDGLQAALNVPQESTS